LIVFTRALKDKVQQKADFPVVMSMRYQRPRPKAVLDELHRRNPELQELIVLPLYPHYTMSSFDTAVAQVKQVHRKGRYPFRIRFLNPFYNHPDYIDALSSRIRPYLEKGYDKILFSYHGLPERHLRKDEERMRQGAAADFQLPGINYKDQAFETTRLVTEQLHIPADRFEISFQSRLTSAGSEWIQPYTVLRVPELAREGVKKLLVVCPAFINDCLETLEEIAIQGKESFLEAGGQSLELIPCINDQDQFAETIVRWAEHGQ
jgi:ferrochelatase